METDFAILRCVACGKILLTVGIVAILGMIHEDIQRTGPRRRGREKDQQAFGVFKMGTEEQIWSVNEANSVLEGEKSDELDEIKSNKSGRKGDKLQLDAVLHKMAGATLGCDYFTLIYECV